VAKSVVAIPVRDEADRIGPCLAALNAQIHRPDAVVLLLNNCTDETETIARGMAPHLGFRLDVVRRNLPAAWANAGHARGLAMQRAAELAGEQGILLTTDADSIAPPDWALRSLRALDKRADIVCGRAAIDPREAAMIPAHLHEDDARECRLIALLDTLAWTLDPEWHDPPPRHTEASGASLAVRVDAYRRVGGIPAIPTGEDRAFVRALWMMDARVRHDPAIEVVVSGRIIGRAEGGMADAIQRRMIQQDEFTDDQVEPVEDAFRRYSLRRRARRMWSGPPDAALARDLGLSHARLSACLAHRFFGSSWAELEARSAVLQRRRVRFVDLPAEIAAAEALLDDVAMPETLAAD
jgi:glycosyltransferase involved in cell wall biosynthesis